MYYVDLPAQGKKEVRFSYQKSWNGRLNGAIVTYAYIRDPVNNQIHYA